MISTNLGRSLVGPPQTFYLVMIPYALWLSRRSTIHVAAHPPLARGRCRNKHSSYRSAQAITARLDYSREYLVYLSRISPAFCCAFHWHTLRQVLHILSPRCLPFTLHFPHFVNSVKHILLPELSLNSIIQSPSYTVSIYVSFSDSPAPLFWTFISRSMFHPVAVCTWTILFSVVTFSPMVAEKPKG